MPAGIVKWFDVSKGFGFITPDEPDDETLDVFVHVSEVVLAGRRELKEGQHVEFERGLSPKTGKMAATNLRILA